MSFLATIPVGIEVLKADAAASVVWLHAFVLTVLVFSFICLVMLRASRGGAHGSGRDADDEP